MLPKYFPCFHYIIVGLDKIGDDFNLPRCYTLKSENGFNLGLDRYFSIDGSTIIALYIFAKEYRENMDLKELRKLVVQALYDNRSVDGYVGGKLRLTTIDKDGFEEVPEADVEDYIEKWDYSNLRRIMEE